MKNKRIKHTPDGVVAAYLAASKEFDRWFARMQGAVARLHSIRQRMKRAARLAEEMGVAGLLDLQAESEGNNGNS